MPEPLTRLLEFLRALAPLQLAEEWDHVGLLVGDERSTIHRVMACLTLTSDVAEEALSQSVDLIVTHHPVLFRPVQRLVAGEGEGEMLLKLIRGNVSVYSPHTAYDNARQGINQQLAELLQLREIAALRPASAAELPGLGSGRFGELPEALELKEFLSVVRARLNVTTLQSVGESSRSVSHVAIACGSAGEFLEDACRLGCDVFLTGEARFHTCQEASRLGIGLVLAGHYATERPGVERLAAALQQEFSELEVWASEWETDPLVWSAE